jgi:hypothetical protein
MGTSTSGEFDLAVFNWSPYFPKRPVVTSCKGKFMGGRGGEEQGPWLVIKTKVGKNEKRTVHYET